MQALHTTQKRIRNELKELKNNKLDFAQAVQDENDQFLFYFLLRGDKDTDYKGGYYMVKIILPKDYPDSPVDYIALTPNGRFLTDKKICLTNSGFHKSNWTPSWNIRNMIVGFSSVFHADLDGGISHIKDTPNNRKAYANDSVNYNTTHYPEIFNKFKQFVNKDGTIKSDEDKILKKQKKEQRKKDKKDKKHGMNNIEKEEEKEEEVIIEEIVKEECDKNEEKLWEQYDKEDYEKMSDEEIEREIIKYGYTDKEIDELYKYTI